jgi:hypothetical protein
MSDLPAEFLIHVLRVWRSLGFLMGFLSLLQNCCYIDIYIFVNCSWVGTRWQYTFTPKQYTEHHNEQQNNKNNKKTTQITNMEECWPCPVFPNYTLAFALQLRKKHGKTSVRVAEEIQRIHSVLGHNFPIFPKGGKLLSVVLCSQRSRLHWWFTLHFVTQWKT